MICTVSFAGKKAAVVPPMFGGWEDTATPAAVPDRLYMLLAARCCTTVEMPVARRSAMRRFGRRPCSCNASVDAGINQR